MKYEYARFGDTKIRRENADHEWENVPDDDLIDAEVEITVKERMIEYNQSVGAHSSARIIRSEQNEAIAEELGINANQLADRLARPDENQGTGARVSEDRFDELMGQIGLDGVEARARFKGTHWTE